MAVFEGVLIGGYVLFNLGMLVLAEKCAQNYVKNPQERRMPAANIYVVNRERQQTEPYPEFAFQPQTFPLEG